ncbi:hypothetical protein [Prosthecobacter sp.]|uniref:hypothetical protein n=1 Tax=Prosthecobacter sp. TaxID=1965333 RepID=UPI003782F9FF
MAGTMVATLLITRGLGGGVGTMSTLSGAQTAGSQYAETYGRLREQGKTHFQAWLSTAPFALGSGLASAFLTAAGGRSGFEAALGGTRAAAREAAQGYWKNLLSNVPKHALADLPQELPDELFSQISSALATGDDVGKVVGDFFKNSPELMGAIMLMGGAGGASGTHQQVNDSLQEAQIQLSSDGNAQDGAQGTPDSGSQIPGNTTSESQDSGQSRAAFGRPSTPPLSVEKSQALIHNVMNKPAEQRAHPTTQADLAQAQWVVREHVRRLESQREPLSAAQEKQLAEARGALARGQPPEAKTTSTHSSGGSLPPGTSATMNGGAPPAGIHTDAPPAWSSSEEDPSPTSATWSTGGEDPTRSSSSATATTNSFDPPDLATAGKALDAVKALQNKGGKITLDEAHQLDQAEKAVASAIKANLEKKKGVTGALSEHETNALNAANATLARPAPRDRGPLPAIPDARRTIQDLSKKEASGPLNADDAHNLAHARRAIAQQRVNDLAALGTAITPQQLVLHC